MADFIMAQANGRKITGVDKIFTAGSRAKEAAAMYGKDQVVNSTIGALLDEQGQLMVLSSVSDVLKSFDPADFAEYAPIAGLPAYKEYVKEVVFGSFKPQSYVEAVASPGGTGALRNAISNYSCRGDKVLTSDWCWGAYSTIIAELERQFCTFPLFKEDWTFNAEGFAHAVESILAEQDQLVLILNTPAHNPTGFTMTDEDWDQVLAVLNKAAENKDKKIVLVADIAYMDFAGSGEEQKSFLKKLDAPHAHNILFTIAFSMSKSFTLYGMRAGALLCMTRSEAVAEEFARVLSFSSRASWSNCNRAAMLCLCRLMQDPALKAKMEDERRGFMELLSERGKIFVEAAKEAGLPITPYHSGFFVSIPCADPDAAAERLVQDNIFVVALSKGIRVSLASVSKAQCAKLPAVLTQALKETQK